MNYGNKDKYDGSWKDGKMDGKGINHSIRIGTYTKSNGDEYNGDWREDKKEGKGSFRTK